MKTTIFALAAIGVAAALTLPAGEASPEPGRTRLETGMVGRIRYRRRAESGELEI